MPRFPHPAVHTKTLSSSVFSHLAQRARQRGGVVHRLHIGDTYKEPLFAARSEAQITDDHPHLHNYAPIQGEPAFLDAIERRLRRRSGRAIDRETIQVMSGATAGLSVVVASLFDPGDEVLLPSPYWPLIRGILVGHGVVPVELPLMDKVDDHVDLETTLREAVTERTAGIYLNTPHNPTGRNAPPTWIEAFAVVAEQHDLWVLSDETYEDLWYTGEPHRPVWDYPQLRSRCVATHTLSKSHGLAGARVGFTHGPPEAMHAVRKTQTVTTYCTPRPAQFGAARALDEGDGWLENARRDYAHAGQRAANVLGVTAPEGGTFLFFDAAPYFGPGEGLAEFLLRCVDAGVLLTPGSACGKDYATHARLCFTSVPPQELEVALEKLRPLLQARR